jgi:tRNA threonylcarbamoyladenosine biosynthesis protein TsaB
LKLLAFDTSTEQLSVAVAHGARVLEEQAAGGALSSTLLIPMVQSLMARAQLTLGELDAIAFGRGPGSFTGLRTACSVAQGLAFGASRPLLPLDTLQAVAEDARHRSGVMQVVAALDARMDEVYWAAYEWREGRWLEREPPRLTKPEQLTVPPGWCLAGNVLQMHAARLPGRVNMVEAAPRAGALLRLAPAAMAAGLAVPPAQALPLYIRDKVAQTTQERRAAREARGAAPASELP